MQVFVEALDKCFENVCELDLIFHCDKVCAALVFYGLLTSAVWFAFCVGRFTTCWMRL